VPVAHLQEGEILFPPVSHQVVPSYEVIGATVRVRSLKVVKALTTAKIKAPAIAKGSDRKSLFLYPNLTYGIWLEFAQFN